MSSIRSGRTSSSSRLEESAAEARAELAMAKARANHAKQLAQKKAELEEMEEEAKVAVAQARSEVLDQELERLSIDGQPNLPVPEAKPMEKVKEYLDSLNRNEPTSTVSQLPPQELEPAKRANQHLDSLDRNHTVTGSELSPTTMTWHQSTSPMAAMQTSMVYTMANTPRPSPFCSASIPTSSPIPYNLESHNVAKPTQILDVTPEGSRNGGDKASSPKEGLPDQVNDVLQTLLQKQGELLSQWAVQSGLPKKELNKFSGDPTDYGRFIRAFEHEVEGKVKEDRDRLYYLEQYTTGDVNQLVRSCMAMEAKKGYAEAKKALSARYGNPFKLADAYFNKVKSFPDIKVEDNVSLSRFSLVLIECKNAMSDLDHLQELNHTRSIQSLTKKLPYRLRDKWRTKTDYIQEERRVEFKDFVQFVERQARILDNPTFGDIKEEKTSYKPIHKHRGTFAVTDTRLCSHCKGNHTLAKCTRFDGLPREAKMEFIRKNNLCYGCLGTGHLSKNCNRRHTCFKCKKGHPTTLHREVLHGTSASAGGGVKEEVTASCDNGEGQCVLAIVPVQVRARRGSKVITTYAFLDPGSTISFCSDGLLQSLGVRGRPARISIETMGARHSIQTETVKNLMVKAVDGDEEIAISMVYSKQSLPVAKVHIPKQEDIDRWPHLNGVLVPKIDSEIGLLIGMGVPDAYTPLQIKTGPIGAPHATRTKLGWVVWNLRRVCESSGGVHPVAKTELLSIDKSLEESRLEKLVRIATEIDFPERGLDSRFHNSVEDKLFIKKVEQTIQKGKDNHYTIGLPFRTDDVVLPNNKTMVIRRLQSLQRRLMKDAKLHGEYTDFMKTLINKGYAEKVPDEEVDTVQCKWYIPHHGVYHPRKPKLRVVFDCAAKFQGVALNDVLIPGPNLTNTLLGVLLRFRENKVALMADVEAMYYQVRVPERDRDFLRFLWFPEGDLHVEPAEYRMRVHLFGATSSPACANKALQQTARDCTLDVGDEAKETLLSNFYVDDLLKSVKDPPTGIRLVKDLKDLCEDGGFNLAKWSSNCKRVIDTIPESERSKELQGINLKEDSIPCERALGVKWHPEGDYMFYEPPSDKQPTTRRGMLSTISSVFDPMGLIAPIILPAKSLLQRTLKDGKGWDEIIDGEVGKQWNTWLDELQFIGNIKIPRCVNLSSENSPCQLHVFADASQKGYGVVAYVRCNVNGAISCNILYSRSRVSPLKVMTIPRLELTAATLAVKSANLIQSEMHYGFDDTFFWTDSMLVINYINNKSTRFSTFVANRITTIHEGSVTRQWRHVGTKNNPADLASRGLRLGKREDEKMWLRGPEFLWKGMEQWPPQSRCNYLKEDDPEVKNVVCVVEKQPDAMETIIHHYSCWSRLRRAISWLMRIKNVLHKKKVNYGCIKLAEMQDAEMVLVKYVQGKHYYDEIKALNCGKQIKKSSTIVRLDPFLDNGVLKVGGRLNRSAMTSCTKHPMILPKENHVSRIIMQEMHRSFGHCGSNQLVTELRKKYWVPQAVSASRSLTRNCVICRRYQRKPQTQKMADLPEVRVTVGDNPFSCTGMDYFGPFEIKRGRTTHKRYGVLFTCMKTRAIHLEVASSLTTDSCISALRRFIARRGPVETITSDNGTNLIGARRELRQAIEEMNTDKIQKQMLSRTIDWRLNPPAASHFGGVWERLIRSTRKILYGILHEQPLKMDDEGLATLLCEVESVVNSRPLTINSDKPDDMEPLTPNHFLLGKGHVTTSPGLFSRADVVKGWRQVQYLTNLFWRRWSSEYLTTLQERQRWTDVKENLRVGDIVLVCDNNSPRGNWQLGRILEVYADQRGYVRSVKLKTKSSELTRPITKLVVLLEADYQ